mgnify:CR=1 FL=1
MKKLKAEGDHLILEKVDYDKEEKTSGGIIIKKSQVLDGSFVEAKIISMGRGLPISNGDIPEVEYSEGDVVLYDARSRIGIHAEYDIIRREHVIAVVNDETD